MLHNSSYVQMRWKKIRVKWEKVLMQWWMIHHTQWQKRKTFMMVPVHHMDNNNYINRILNLCNSTDIIMLIYKKCMKEKLIVLKDLLDNRYNHRLHKNHLIKIGKTLNKVNRLKIKCKNKMQDLKNHH